MGALHTEITKLLGIRHPVLLAGMGNIAHRDLVAAVSNAGGLGTIGGIFLNPKMLRKEIKAVKALLHDKQSPKFGVDLLIPKVGSGARKTNSDYNEGNLPELINVIIEEKTTLFVSAVGVPPRWVVEKLHKAGIPVMNMCGAPRHAHKAIEVGCDIVCCQGSEGGGHTGDIGTSVLVPECVDICRGKTSELTGGPVLVVAAGGIFDGRGLAAALAYGAHAVWVGTRFVATKEAAASRIHKKNLLASTSSDTIRTLIYSGRPLRCIKNDYIMDWEENRSSEIKALTAKGVLPYQQDMADKQKSGESFSIARSMPHLCGQCAGPIHEVTTAAEVVEELVQGAISAIKTISKL
uniref:2-nitropropane dioxygenase n=2 Tax=Hirondellea gigas TaxID=1518452 RepID=A0A6A7FW60_9CRUS